MSEIVALMYTRDFYESQIESCDPRDYIRLNELTVELARICCKLANINPIDRLATLQTDYISL